MTIFRHAYALAGSTLVSFNPATPSVGTSIPVTGVLAGQTLVGIDVRPANGLLYGLGVNAATDTATLYTISGLTGGATIVGSFGVSETFLLQAMGSTSMRSSTTSASRPIPVGISASIRTLPRSSASMRRSP